MLTKSRHFIFWRILTTLVMICMVMAGLDIRRILISLGVVFSLTTFWWIVVTGIMVFSAVGILVSWSPVLPKVAARFSKFHQNRWPRSKLLGWAVVVTLAFLYSTWVLRFGHLLLNGFFPRIMIFLLITSISALFIRPLSPGMNWKIALACSMVVTTFFYKSLIYIFPAMSLSPFSVSWSEGSRYYYASLLFSRQYYGMDIPLSLLHPTRYMLLSLPFMIPNLPIIAHRIWQVSLWVGVSGLAGYLLTRRLKIKHPLLIISFAAWSFLIINLGPVYYHLVICIILIYWGTDFDKPVKTMVFLILASIWAGLSRINWVPVPTFLVITLYILECPWDKTRVGWKYLLKPLKWILGIVVAFLSYLIYINLSGDETSKFASSFTSDLLWNRLWPNSTYKFGILFGVIIYSLPLLFILYFRLREVYSFRNPWKWIIYTILLATLLFGGLIVSIKIGGGSNLHNMDSYFILLFTPASYMFWKQDIIDFVVKDQKQAKQIPTWITVIAIIIPVLLTIREGWVITHSDIDKDRIDLNHLQQIVSDTAESGGEVLFIAERQLQVFDLVPDIPLIPEYEKIELMEMAMSGNAIYLNRFSEDIANKRFSLIISDSFRIDMKDETQAFSEEHNLWAERIIVPLVESYDYSPLGDRKNIFLFKPMQSE